MDLLCGFFSPEILCTILFILFASTVLHTHLYSDFKYFLIYLTDECPKVFEDFGVRKKVEKWQFSDKFGRISG